MKVARTVRGRPVGMDTSNCRIDWPVRPPLSMGAVFTMFSGIYYWFDKMTGLWYSEVLGQIHFWTFFIGVNITFFPMHFLGVAGMPRRIPDYPDAYYMFNKIASWGSYISAFSALMFFLVILEALLSNRKAHFYYSELPIGRK